MFDDRVTRLPEVEVPPGQAPMGWPARVDLADRRPQPARPSAEEAL